MRINNPEIIFSNSGLLSALYFAKLVTDTLLDCKRSCSKSFSRAGLSWDHPSKHPVWESQGSWAVDVAAGGSTDYAPGNEGGSCMASRDPASGVTSVVLHGVKQWQASPDPRGNNRDSLSPREGYQRMVILLRPLHLPKLHSHLLKKPSLSNPHSYWSLFMVTLVIHSFGVCSHSNFAA